MNEQPLPRSQTFGWDQIDLSTCNNKNSLCLHQRGFSLNRKNIIFLFICLWYPLQKKTSLCNIRCHYRTLQPNLRIVDTSPNGYIYKVHLYLRYWEHWIDEVERFQKPEDHGVYCETLSLSNVRNYTYKVSPTWLPEQE